MLFLVLPAPLIPYCAREAIKLRSRDLLTEVLTELFTLLPELRGLITLEDGIDDEGILTDLIRTISLEELGSIFLRFAADLAPWRESIFCYYMAWASIFDVFCNRLMLVTATFGSDACSA